jgi:hypothetical protein
VLALVASAVAYVGAEVAYRAYLFGPRAALSITRMKSLAAIGVSGMTQAATADPDLIYELKPNLDLMFKLVPFRSSSQGLRDREYPLEKPPGTVRIAAIGDSFTMGSGVEMEDVYPKVLERELTRTEGRPFEVLDFGVGGYGLRQYVAVMKTKALAWHPDLFLVGFCPNDVRDRPASDYRQPYRPLPVRQQPFLYPYLALDLWDATGARLLAGPSSAGVSVRAEQGSGGPTYVDEQFRRMKAASQASGVGVAMLWLGMSSNGAADVRRAADAAGIAFIDPSPRFGGRPERSLWIHRRDGHPNAVANRVFAEAVADAVRSGQLRLVP